MGVFDVCCAESGLVLGGDARLILLAEESPGRFEPIALPISGAYDRLGGIDLPEPYDTNVGHIAAFCARLEFDELPRDASFEERLPEMAHAVSEGRWGRIWGRKVAYALVDGRIYGAIAENAEDTLEKTLFEELFERAFPMRDLSMEVYGSLGAGEKRALRADLAEFVRYREWGTALKPVDLEESGQFTGYSAKEHPGSAAEPFVKAARKKYARHPHVLEAVEANAEYWKEIEDRR